MLVLKLMAVVIISWLLGVTTYLISLYVFYGETIGKGDLIAVLVWSALAFLLAAFLIYIPVMFLLRRLLGGCKPVFAFPLVASLLLIVPTMGILLIWGGGSNLIDSLFRPEAMLFYGLFLAVGVSFGLGFAWCYRTVPSSKSFERVAK